MKLTLYAVSDALFYAFRDAFAPYPEVDVVLGDILSVETEGIVSPANSFGWMDGGIDLHYRNFFGHGIERDVMTQIAKRPGCELPVGEAMAVMTGDSRIGWLIVAPTMRVPGIVAASANAYHAFRAALLTARAHGIQRLSSPGMATGVGRMHPVQAAAQMARAWGEFNRWPAFNGSLIEFHPLSCCTLPHVS
ncbi:macro domain-containing protein [Burkholderia sp. TSV86]|uniref:macro domain-containing protein n=1 Tax=Burkholderia sp. TSV86 TaxID=1385594 RepID=UPI00075779E9|nr:macro domain-containing protein [Burkholderia sp. TSV86]KVE35250.1 hypothetical protein WS68_07575 [Burkholderia sp. TSV86]